MALIRCYSTVFSKIILFFLPTFVCFLPYLFTSSISSFLSSSTMFYPVTFLMLLLDENGGARLCGLPAYGVAGYRRFGETCCHHLQSYCGMWILSFQRTAVACSKYKDLTLEIEAVISSKTSVTSY
jgi:hypothetical protein